MSKKAKRREEARLQAFRQQDSLPIIIKKIEPQQQTKTHSAKLFFDRNYKKLMILPSLLLLLCILQIGWQIHTTGDFVVKSVSLRGGSTISILQNGLSVATIESALQQQFPEEHIGVTAMSGESGVMVTADFTDSESLKPLIIALEEQTGVTSEKYTVEIIGASLGASFFRQTMIAVLIAFLFMSIVVFISFRSIAPASFVVLASFSDIVSTLAIFNLLGQELTTAGIAAFLMLIGYSLDTDVLLSARVLRRKEGTVTDATFDAMGTGLMMCGTTAAVSFVGIFLAKSDTLLQIMMIIFIGVCWDIIYTWLQNAPILKWYLERKGVSHG